MKRGKYKYQNQKHKKRLVVRISNTNIYAQVIDDVEGKTIVAASTLKDKEKTTIQGAELIGTQIAEAALKQDIKEVVLDRGRRKRYHGRIKALANKAREKGLKI